MRVAGGNSVLLFCHAKLSVLGVDLAAARLDTCTVMGIACPHRSCKQIAVPNPDFGGYRAHIKSWQAIEYELGGSNTHQYL